MRLVYPGIAKRLNAWNKSIFARLLFTFFIMMIPIYFLGISIYNWGISTIQEEIRNSRSSQVSSFMGKLENDIIKIKKLQFDLLLSDDLNRLANGTAFMNDYERNRLMLLIQQRLNAIKSSSDYISNIFAVMPTIHKTISVNGVDDLKDEDMKLLNLKDTTSHSQIIVVDNQLYMNAPYSIASIARKTVPSYSITIMLSLHGLQDALKQFDYYDESGTILFRSRDSFSISTSRDPAVSKIMGTVSGYLQNSSEGKSTIMVDNRKYLAIYENSSVLDFAISSYVPENVIYKSLARYQIWFWFFSLAAVVIVAVFTLSTHRLIQRPFKKLFEAFSRLRKGEMNFALKHNHDDEFKYLYENFNEMLLKLNEMIEQSYKQTIMIQKAELKQLQAQINPHFLYNSFFILYTMSRHGDNENLERFAMQLGEYFQFVTRSAADEVPLGREVSHARTYCDIQVTRFAKRIKVIFNEPSQELVDLIVPRLIIQPIIENAFEHGLEKKKKDGLLVVSFEKDKNLLCIHVEDNGEVLTDQEIEELQNRIDTFGEEVEATAILNIHRRIQLKFGKESGISVSRGSLGGLLISVRIIISSVF